MNIIIADIIHYLHIVLVVYVLVGWLITPVKKIHYYIIFVIFILLDWNDLDGQCFLTKIEHYFRERARKQSETESITTNGHDGKITIHTETGEPEFFRPLINRLFNIELTSKDATRINYFTFISAILLAFLRMLHHRGILNFSSSMNMILL